MSALRPPDNGVLAEGPLLDTRSVEYLAERLAAVPGVVAVTPRGVAGGRRGGGGFGLGLRAVLPGRSRPGGHQRAGLARAGLRAGRVGSIVNGGAWLTAGGARVDLIYRSGPSPNPGRPNRWASRLAADIATPRSLKAGPTPEPSSRSSAASRDPLTAPALRLKA